MKRSRAISLAAIVLTSVLCASCSSERDAQRMELAQLESAISDANRAIDDLQQNAADAERSAYYAYVSARLLNAVLAGLDGAVIHPDGRRDLEIHVRSIRTNFVGGSPMLSVSAAAKLPSADLMLDLAVEARLKIELGPTSNELRARIQVVHVEPKVRWSVFDLSTLRAVRKLASLGVSDFADQMPSVPLPLQAQLNLSMTAGAKQMALETAAGGTVSVRVNYPAVPLQVKSRISRVLFLHDGLHVFGEIGG